MTPTAERFMGSDVPGVLRCAAINAHKNDDRTWTAECSEHHECRVYQEYCARMKAERAAGVPDETPRPEFDVVCAIVAQVYAMRELPPLGIEKKVREMLRAAFGVPPAAQKWQPIADANGKHGIVSDGVYVSPAYPDSVGIWTAGPTHGPLNPQPTLWQPYPDLPTDDERIVGALTENWRAAWVGVPPAATPPTVESDAPISTRHGGNHGIPFYLMNGQCSPEFDQGHWVIVWYDDLVELNERAEKAKS